MKDKRVQMRKKSNEDNKLNDYYYQISQVFEEQFSDKIKYVLLCFVETISLIFGSDNARLGAERLFELFQDVQLNKHLCYVRNKIIF
jgi:hypothetical protein